MLPSGRAILILTPAHFLATKLEASQARGGSDIRLSPDWEDIIYLLDNRPELSNEVVLADTEVRRFIRKALGDLLINPSLQEAIEAALGFGTARERAKVVQNLMGNLASGTQ